MRHDVPQTAGAAVDDGWQWLAIRCVYCRHRTRVMFAGHDRSEPLVSIVRRMRCRRCPEMTPQVDVAIGRELSAHEKPITFVGEIAVKIGMT